VRETPGSDDTRLRAQLGDDAVEDAVDQADVAVVEAALQVAHGVGADDLGGALDVDAAQPCGAGEERFRAEPEAGRNDAAQVSPRSEMTSNLVAVPKSTTMHGPPYFSNAAMESQRRSAPSSVGLSTSTGMPVLMPGSTKKRLDVEVGLAHLAKRGVDGRDDRRDDDVLDLRGVDALHVEEIDEQRAVLVHGLCVVGGESPVGGQRLRVETEETELGIGIADVECEKHVFPRGCAGIPRSRSFDSAEERFAQDDSSLLIQTFEDDDAETSRLYSSLNPCVCLGGAQAAGLYGNQAGRGAD